MLVKSGQDILIAVRAALDKVEGFRNESFLDQEIGLFVNKGMFRLLDDLINKNFQQGTLRYEWLRPFQAISNAVPVSWADASTVESNVDFPTELYYLISADGISKISSTNPTVGFDGGCYQDIADPNSIVNEFSKKVQIDIIETGQAIDRTHNSFYGNNSRSPRAEALEDGIKIFRDQKFIISDVFFNYIVEPNEIDVSSSSDTQWPESANRKIVDYTVEYMRLTIGDQLYQGNVNDFNTRTQNA